MFDAYRTHAARVDFQFVNESTIRYRSLTLVAGILAIGCVVIAAGGAIGAMLESPLAPRIEKLAAIRLAGIGIFSAGIGLLPAPAASLRRAFFAYSALATLYFCSLMLAALLVREAWPVGWIVTASALHGAALTAIVVDWLRHHPGEVKLVRGT